MADSPLAAAASPVAFLPGFRLPDWAPAAPGSAALLLLAVALLFLLPSARRRLRAGIDRLFSRTGYEIEPALSNLSRSLAAARTIEAVVGHTTEVLSATLSPARTFYLRRDGDRRFRAASTPGAEEIVLLLPADLAARVERGEILPRHAWEGKNGRRAGAAAWNDCGFALLMPIGAGGPPAGILALGAKDSGGAYDAHDLVFLRTAANLIALAMINAAAFDQLDALNQHLGRMNERLEQQVSERTAALHTSNRELNESLEKLQHAYRRLEQTHDSLLRADRLATVGRLTAGLAHEMNTPLSAVLNSLKVIKDLAEEYSASIDDPQVVAADHHEIAKEILLNTRSAAEWASKAAAYIRSVKSHGRETRPGTTQRFFVGDVVADARALVAHRLRTATCVIDYAESPESVSLEGEPGRFGQVLVNLISNAIDAYEERGAVDGRIEIRTSATNGAVRVQVQDWAGGIPDAVLPHIFDELYTTKGPGRGTGLGLWISRNLVEQGFGGTLDVMTNREGSCFIAEFPATERDVNPAPPAPALAAAALANAAPAGTA
jgi:signal transduction histidine kinase